MVATSLVYCTISKLKSVLNVKNVKMYNVIRLEDNIHVCGHVQRDMVFIMLPHKSQ